MNLTQQYQKLHEQGHFPGNSTAKWSQHIKALIDKHQPKSILDYGCGKGLQYYKDKLHDQWGVEMPALYDPGVPQLANRNILNVDYDLIICTDVMEHLDGAGLYLAFKDILFAANKAAFIAITCRPAKKMLPDGRNCHITVQPPIWWRGYAEACKGSGFGFSNVDVTLEFEEEL
jgi:hypothetical protein